MTSHAPIPETMWLSSTEHASWGTPRFVRAHGFVVGPSPDRDYLWLSYQPLVQTGPDDELVPRDVVVSPRFSRHFEAPQAGCPVHVHLWVVREPEQLAKRRFDPGKPRADAWCSLYRTRDEAAAEAAQPW